MLNILVSTDFSPLSKIALEYAIKIANQLNGNITLLNVIKVGDPVRNLLYDKIQALEDNLINTAERNINELIKEVEKDLETSEPLKFKVVRSSNFEKAMATESKKLRSGLIIMGTHGASGLKKAVIGSNTASVIENSHIPVLAVPEEAKFKGFKEIVYASDLKNIDKELKRLIPYMQKFKATLHILHVASAGNDVDELQEKIDKASKKSGYKDIVSIVSVDQNIEGAIDQYIGTCKADMLAMFTHDLTFYEKLFDKSVTRKMAFQSSIPLLAFRAEL